MIILEPAKPDPGEIWKLIDEKRRQLKRAYIHIEELNSQLLVARRWARRWKQAAIRRNKVVKFVFKSKLKIPKEPQCTSLLSTLKPR